MTVSTPGQVTKSTAERPQEPSHPRPQVTRPTRLCPQRNVSMPIAKLQGKRLKVHCNNKVTVLSTTCLPKTHCEVLQGQRLKVLQSSVASIGATFSTRYIRMSMKRRKMCTPRARSFTSGTRLYLQGELPLKALKFQLKIQFAECSKIQMSTFGKEPKFKS